MTEKRKNPLVVAKKRGFPIYSDNPSIPSSTAIKKEYRAQFGNEHRGIVLDTNKGEILGHGGAMFYEWKEVDKNKFVKMYMEGIRQSVGLSKSGVAVFELVYYQIQEKPDNDKVNLSVHTSGLEERTYQRGLRELLEKEFLYRSPYDGTFFVNIRYMFNGDRLAFVKGFQLKKEKDSNQLPLL